MKERFCLRRPGDFRKVFKEGKRFLSPHFVLYMLKGAESSLPGKEALPSAGQARIGISIAKRHFKLATRRNRLRRIAKEMFKSQLSASFKGYDFVVASRGAHPRSNISEAVKELKHLITKPLLTGAAKKT
jgi:ribonuclease P protein component